MAYLPHPQYAGEPLPHTCHGIISIYKASLQLEAELPELGPCLANLCNPRSQARSRCQVGTWYTLFPSLIPQGPEEACRREVALKEGRTIQIWWLCEPPHCPKQLMWRGQKPQTIPVAQSWGALSSSVGLTRYQLCDLRKSLNLADPQFLSKVGGIPSNYYEDQIR